MSYIGFFYKGLIHRHAPVRIRIVAVHLADDSGSVFAQVTLVHPAALVDDESHDTRISISGRPGDHGKTANHVAINDVAVFASRGVATLSGEDFEQVSMKRQ